MEYFHRFLSRVFEGPADSGWVLKGGTSMLARVASARATTDVDLFRQRRTLEDALADLRKCADAALDDHFRFEYVGHTDALEGGQQTCTAGYRVIFDVYIGVKWKGALHVDLVVGVATTDVPEVARPAHALDLPKLPSRDYRLYPVVDQIADKICATLALYGGGPSTREKDLVDLVVLAVTHDVSARKLRHALEVEAKIRGLSLPETLQFPGTWGRVYAKLARDIPACAGHRSVDAAIDLMHEFIDPVLDGSVTDDRWHHAELRWR